MRLFRDKKSKYWYLDYIDPRTHKRRRVSTKCTVKAEAAEWARRFLSILAGDLPEPQEPLYLSQLIPRFLDYKRRTIRAPWRYEIAFRHILRIMGDCPVHAIDRKWILTYRERRLREVGPVAVNREHAAISSFLSWCVEMGYIDANPALRIKKLKEPPPRSEYLTRSEIRKLLSTPCPNPHLRMMTIIALATGMRRGEILALTPADITDEEIIVRNSKTGKSRTVPLPDFLRKELKQYLPIHSDGERVIPIRHFPKRAWRTWLKRAGIRYIRFHDLRRTFGVHYAAGTGNLRELAAILGHGSAYTTERYSPYAGEYREQINRKVETIFGHILNGADEDRERGTQWVH